MNSTLTYRSCALTDVGRRRTINEDAFLCSDSTALWAVADGMGGHNAGDVASTTVIDALRKYAPTTTLADTLDSLQRLIRGANQALYEQGHSTTPARIMGTTIVAFALCCGQGVVLWAGDSRLYRLRNDTLSQLTSDHSLVQEMLDRGEITPQESHRHPSANVITRAVGIKEPLLLEIAQIDVQAGDRFLLCSDGLYREMSDEEITSLFGNSDIDDASHRLVDAALGKGGRDNITALMIDFSPLPDTNQKD